MNSRPSENPVVQQLQLLLTGYGYNFYSTVNQARSDDLLVRERASYHLAQAADMLANLRSAYQRKFVPPLTRANPDPPQEALAQMREMETIQQELSNVETHIRGMSVPSQDRIWWRIRQEQTLLSQLLSFDLSLVNLSEQLYRYVAQLTPEEWQQQGSSSLQQFIRPLVQVARDRERFLLFPM
ncbi:MAG TPA: hypothetical protein VL485_26325 [Ktedonobacteraceae bacterium]|jgi:hypothetical protein|nr:hypothetical protein [Ktedonobacteraceae bacterium]